MTITADTPPSAVDAHDASVAAYDAHQDKIRAWNKAVTDAEAVRTDLKTAGDGLTDKYRGLSGPQWVLTAGDIAGGLSGARLEYNASALKKTAKTFKAQAVRDLDRALQDRSRRRREDPVVPGPRPRPEHVAPRPTTWRGPPAPSSGPARRCRSRPAGRWRRPASCGTSTAARTPPRRSPRAPAASSPRSARVPRPAPSSARSCRSPGVGTAAGAIIGAGVGIFTSGAIDSLFENGPDVGEAAEAGWDAVKDTGGAIVDGAGAVGDAIGGLFD